MSHEEIFEKIKDNFAGVKMIGGGDIILSTKNGEEFKVNQNEWDLKYEIRFHCGGGNTDCDSCSEHGSEKWEVLKK